MAAGDGPVGRGGDPKGGSRTRSSAPTARANPPARRRSPRRAGRADQAHRRPAWSRAALPALLVVGALALSACAAGPNNVSRVNAPHVAGFWLGLWHGIICPVTFFVSLFNHHVNIYDVHNDGNWYNFGFVLGAGILFGGGSHAGSRRR